MDKNSLLGKFKKLKKEYVLRDVIELKLGKEWPYQEKFGFGESDKLNLHIKYAEKFDDKILEMPDEDAKKLFEKWLENDIESMLGEIKSAHRYNAFLDEKREILKFAHGKDHLNFSDRKSLWKEKTHTDRTLNENIKISFKIEFNKEDEKLEVVDILLD